MQRYGLTVRWPFGVMTKRSVLHSLSYFVNSAGHLFPGRNVPRLLRALTDPKRRTRPFRPLRGRTFLRHAPFLTGSSGALRLRLCTDGPGNRCPAPAKGNGGGTQSSSMDFWFWRSSLWKSDPVFTLAMVAITALYSSLPSR